MAVLMKSLSLLACDRNPATPGLTPILLRHSDGMVSHEWVSMQELKPFQTTEVAKTVYGALCDLWAANVQKYLSPVS